MASAWEIKGIPKFDKLKTDTTAEVCIIGGGLAGVWTAYLLTKAGKHVVLLDADRVGQGATMYTTAFLTQSIDTDLKDLIQAFGKKDARLILDAHGRAIDMIEETAKRERIECEFARVDNRIFASDEKGLHALAEELQVAEELEQDVVLRRTAFPGFKNVGGLVWKKQGKYHPMKFFRGLLEAAIENGLEVFEGAEVTEIAGTSVFSVRTKQGKTVECQEVVVTTYDPFNNPEPVHWKKGMYESYVYELKVKHGLIPPGTYEDDKNPYHYFRIDAGAWADRLIVGGEDHRAELVKALEKKSFKALREWVDETFPGLKYTVENKWRGGILEPSDGLALIGEYASRQYLAAAFSGNGMTYSALAGQILSDLILGKESPYARIFDPKRKLDKRALSYKFRDYAEEFFKGAGKNIWK